MSDDLIKEAKKHVLNYMTENYPTSEEGKMLKKAKKRVNEKKAFYIQIIIYVPLMILLAGISIFLTPKVWWWFLFPAAGWGIALLIQYFLFFGIPGVGRFDEGWEAHQIQQEFFKLKEQKEFEDFLNNRKIEAAKQESPELSKLDKRLDEDDLV